MNETIIADDVNMTKAVLFSREGNNFCENIAVQLITMQLLSVSDSNKFLKFQFPMLPASYDL